MYKNFTNCHDLLDPRNCSIIKNNNQCETEQSRCAKTCGFCSDLNGPNCTSLTNPCLNGVCSELVFLNITTSSCTCNESYAGAKCDRKKSCLSDPCKNGGICTDTNQEDLKYTCQCPYGCTGTNCEKCYCNTEDNFECKND